MFYWILKFLTSPIIKLLWIKKKVGLENVPKKGSFIVVANHSSYFDFISLVAVFPRRIYFLTAEKFYKSKFWYPIVAWTGQIKVDRNSANKADAYKKAFAALENNNVLGIFPEGTRSHDGKIGKTYTGVAKFALASHSPVVPVGISGAYEVMSRHEKRPKIKKNIVIKIGKPMFFDEYYEKTNNETTLRQVTDKIMVEIEKLKI